MRRFLAKSAFLRSLYRRIYHPHSVIPSAMGWEAIPEQRYDTWMNKTEPLLVDLVDKQFSGTSERPLMSIVMPVYNTPPNLLERAIKSVIHQDYERWQLCICDDASTDDRTLAVLEKYRDVDLNINIVRLDVNSHISAATNAAIEIAEGEWISFLDHDDVLAPHALRAVVVAINLDPDLKIIYSDEDKILEDGERCLPFFKTDIDRLLLLGQNFVNHFLTIKKTEIDRIGGLSIGVEGVQDWDLVLRVSEHVGDDEICHIPLILYHWGVHEGSTASAAGSGVEQKSYIEHLGKTIVSGHLARTNRDAEVSLAPINYWVRVDWRVPIDAPMVDIIIPTRDGKKFRECITSLLEKTTYPNYSISIIDNGSTKRSTLKLLKKLSSRPDVHVFRDPGPFNYSRLNNEAVQRSESPLVCLLNDDVEVIDGDWLSSMVGHVLQDGVGVVGAKLFYPDMTIQHAGVLLGMGGAAGHVHTRNPDSYDGYFGNALLSRNVSCVTGACLLVHRELWHKLDGLDETDFAIAFNDVDFCLKVQASGKKIIWDANAKLIHHESLSRGADTHGAAAERHRGEIIALTSKWSHQLMNDPFYNPNLALNFAPYECSDSSRLLKHTWPVGSSYFNGQRIESINRSFEAGLSGSRFMVLNRVTNSIVWTTEELEDIPFQIAFQHDGNLVVYSQKMRPLWDSSSMNDSARTMELSDMGTLCLFGSDGEAYWSASQAFPNEWDSG